MEVICVVLFMKCYTIKICNKSLIFIYVVRMVTGFCGTTGLQESEEAK